MRALKLAIALLMIPRLAARMVLFPVAIAGSALLVQLWLLSLKPPLIIPSGGDLGGINVPRKVAYGSSEQRPPIVTCRWTSKRGSPEFPPGKACLVEFHDLAILGTPESKQDPAEAALVERLSGNFEKVHYCEASCAQGAGIVIRRGAEPQVLVSGFSNLILLKDSLAPLGEDDRGFFALPGQLSFDLPGLNRPVLLTGLAQQVAQLLSIIMLIVCCVWLTLRAHKRVLDYFSSSGSLLPLAASAGPRTLYGALWAISGFRLLAFLGLSMPVVAVLGLPADLGGSSEVPSNGRSALQMATPYLWIVAVTASLVLTTLCASVADLKRRMLSSVLWRIFPLVLVGIGFAAWCVTLLADSPEMAAIRNCIVAMPLLGLAPLVAASIVEPPALLLLIHAVIASLLAVVVARSNARWFATHLEES